MPLSPQLLRVRPEDAGLCSAIERHETAQFQRAVYTQNVRRMLHVLLTGSLMLITASPFSVRGSHYRAVGLRELVIT